jgi:NADH/NAD ratio-sensing transcriptional regulator Rex
MWLLISKINDVGEDTKMKVLEIANKEYEIKFSINTLCRMESDGLDVMHINTIIENINFTLIRKLFFYGIMASAGKGFTEAKAGDMMDEYLADNDYNELMTVLVSELARALGYDIDAKEKQEAEESDTEAGK